MRVLIGLLAAAGVTATAANAAISTGDPTLDRFDSQIEAAVAKYGFPDPLYAKAMAWWESNQVLDPEAVSDDSPCGGSGLNSKSIGIFQITPECGEGEGHSAEELKDPGLNIDLGVKHLTSIYNDMQSAHPGCTERQYLDMTGAGWVQNYETIEGCGQFADERQTNYANTVGGKYEEWGGAGGGGESPPVTPEEPPVAGGGDGDGEETPVAGGDGEEEPTKPDGEETPVAEEGGWRKVRLGEFTKRQGKFERRNEELEAAGKEDADFTSRWEDMKKRFAEFRGSDLPEVDGGTEPEECTGATGAEKVAFKTAAVTLGGLSTGEAEDLDFSCDTGGEEAQATAGAAERRVGEELVARSGGIAGENGASWTDNGVKSFNTQEPWATGQCDLGYGEACMDPSNVKEAGDFIVLEGEQCEGQEKPYCGAEITTRGIKDIVNGTVEVKAIVDSAEGSFHAPGWLMGNGTGAEGWPKTGEIDFAEGVGTDGKMYLTVHWGDGQHYQISKPGAQVNMEELNTYAVRKGPDEIVQIVNGEETAKITRAEVEAKGPGGSVLFDDPMHFRADKAAGGGWALPNGGEMASGAVRIQKGSVKFTEDAPAVASAD